MKEFREFRDGRKASLSPMGSPMGSPMVSPMGSARRQWIKISVWRRKYILRVFLYFYLIIMLVNLYIVC